MIKNKKSTALLVICLIIIVGLCVVYSYKTKTSLENKSFGTNNPNDFKSLNNNISPSEKKFNGIVALIAEQPVYIFAGRVTQKVSKNINPAFAQQYEIDVVESVKGILKSKKVIINEPSDVKYDQSLHTFIAIYDPKNDWYDTEKFQDFYTLSGKILNRVGDKSIGMINVVQYNVNIDLDHNVSTLLPIRGNFKMNVLSSNEALENKKEYYFYALRNSENGEFVVIDVKRSISSGGDQ